jgi:hypothetical protein
MEKLPKTTQENKIEKPKIKEGVDFVFEQNPELSKIGTKEQYSEYLDTIFPESKLKDIVYHASHNKIEKFRDSMFGIYFSYSPIKGTHGNNIHSAILDAKNILVLPKLDNDVEIKEIYNKDYRNYNNPTSFSSEGFPIYKYDSSLEISTVTKEGRQIKVRNPEQIYILGSQSDLEKFKEFVRKNTDSQG